MPDWMRTPQPRFAVLSEIALERIAQDRKWGVQDHPSVDPELLHALPRRMAERYGIPAEIDAKYQCNRKDKEKRLTYCDIAVEELAEAVGLHGRRKGHAGGADTAGGRGGWVD